MARRPRGLSQWIKHVALATAATWGAYTPEFPATDAHDGANDLEQFIGADIDEVIAKLLEGGTA